MGCLVAWCGCTADDVESGEPWQLSEPAAPGSSEPSSPPPIEECTPRGCADVKADVCGPIADGCGGELTCLRCVVRLEVTPDPVPPQEVGQRVALSAQAYDADGQPVSCAVTWRAADTRVATVGAQGEVVAQEAGATAITARCEGIEDTVEVEVEAPVEVEGPEPLLWLRADRGVMTDGTAVTAWQGQGRGAYIARQTRASARPVLEPTAANGQPALRFDGAQHLDIKGGVVGLEDGTIFVVAKNGRTHVGQLVAGCHKANMQFRFNGLARSMFLYSYHGADIRSKVFEMTIDWVRQTTGRFWTYTLRLDATSDAVFYQGDTEVGRAPIVREPPSVDTFHVGQLGGRCDYEDTAESLVGEIAEVMIFDVALTDAQRAQVWRYLTDKYAL